MDCREYEYLITDYLEKKCTPEQRRRIETHFSGCESCRVMAADEQAVIDRLSSMQPAACPDEVIDQVMEKIDIKRMTLMERISSWLTVNPSWRYAASLAGTALIVILAVLLSLPPKNNKIKTHQEFTEAEIQQAKAEAEMALAYFSVYSNKTITAVEEVKIMKQINQTIDLKLKKALGEIPYI